MLDVSSYSGPSCTCGFGIREKNPMRFAVFGRISVRYCGFRTPLTPPALSIALSLNGEKIIFTFKSLQYLFIIFEMFLPV